MVVGYVICICRHPLKATETLMPKVMDVDCLDCVRYLFETQTRVRGNLHVPVFLWMSTIQVPIGVRRCKMTQRLDWLYMTLIELATDS